VQYFRIVQYIIIKKIYYYSIKKVYYITCGAYFRNTEILLGSLPGIVVFVLTLLDPTIQAIGNFGPSRREGAANSVVFVHSQFHSIGLYSPPNNSDNILCQFCRRLAIIISQVCFLVRFGQVTPLLRGTVRKGETGGQCRQVAAGEVDWQRMQFVEKLAGNECDWL